MCWLDDEFLVSGSRDTRMALWRITPDMLESRDEVPRHQYINAISVKDCKNAQKVSMKYYFSKTIFTRVLFYFKKNASYGFHRQIGCTTVPNFRIKFSNCI